MIINTNVAALSSYRQMGMNQNAAQNSMEKLSSGLRINRAGDDAAGLAISEKMRAQIRGLDQASRNAQDGISMIQTAEGALQETHNILQRMRELATQAANDTNVEIDRNEIQKEMNQLTSEINRIGNTTEFNTQNLLDGGAKASGVSLSSTEAQGVAAAGGKITALDKVVFGTGTPSDQGSITALNENHDLIINVDDFGGNAGIEFKVDGNAFKTLWNQTDAGKAGDEATNAMRREALVEVLGKITSTADFELADGTDRTVSLAEVVDINVSSSGVLSLQSKVGGGDITIGDGTATEFDTLLGIDSSSDIVGVGVDQEEATLYGGVALKNGTELTLSDWAGKSFDITFNGRTQTITLGSEDSLALGGNSDKDEDILAAEDLVTAFNSALDAAFGDDAVKASIAKNPNNVNDEKLYFQFTTDSTVGGAGKDVVKNVTPEFSIKGDNLDKILGDFVPGTKGSGGEFSATFQIGANNGQSMTINVGDMRSLALGISGATTGEQGEVDGARFTKTSDVTDGTSSRGVEYALDVSTHENATAAIEVLNNAIEQVSAQRSELGAFQNRLEHTISNLDNASENLQAAESRIRDVDMAREVMEMTKNNILSQASQAMLAQANQQPQSVLQLLG